MNVIMGATGNTGNVIARKLLEKGQKVRVLARNPDRLKNLVALGAEPCVCDVTDPKALTQAFQGARAVYTMIPPNIDDPDPRGFQERVGEAIAIAIEEAGVKHAVTLSSVGADKPDKTGPIVGLRHLEERLNLVGSLNVLHLRPGYFMENTLEQIGIIQQLGKTAGPLRPDLKVPVIATRDIGEYAADALLQLDFRGHRTRELLGQRDLTSREEAAVIGRAIGKPDLEYVQLPETQVRAALVQLGMSPAVADLILEMSAALNQGHVKALELRSVKNTTPTSYETFVAEAFVPRYRSRAAA